MSNGSKEGSQSVSFGVLREQQADPQFEFVELRQAIGHELSNLSRNQHQFSDERQREWDAASANIRDLLLQAQALYYKQPDNVQHVDEAIELLKKVMGIIISFTST